MTNIKPYHNAFDETAVTSAGALFTKLKGTQCEHNQLQIRSKHSESAENSSVRLVESIKWVIWSWSPTKLFFFTSACFMEKKRIIEILFCLNNRFFFFFFLSAQHCLYRMSMSYIKQTRATHKNECVLHNKTDIM